MPILIKTNSGNNKCIQEWAIIELQGDLEVRSNEILNGQFIGDLCYNKYGQPIFIIGHHILQGREQKIDKPFAVLEKSKTNDGISLDQTTNNCELLDSSILSCTSNTTITSTATTNQTILDSTVAIENKSKQKTEYTVRAIVTRKLIFKSRPKPIIANVTK